MTNVNGEVRLNLGGTDYVLVPKWKAIKELENGIEDSITSIMQKIAVVNVTSIVRVLAVALKHSGYSEFTEDKVGDAVINGGLKEARRAASDWLTAFVVAPEDVKSSEGEATPAA